MLEKEIIEKQKEGGNSELYLVKVGMFYHAYDAGAYALAHIMGYAVKRKHRRCGDVLTAGFPTSQLQRVVEKAAEMGVTISPDALAEDAYVIKGGDTTPVAVEETAARKRQDEANQSSIQKRQDDSGVFREICSSVMAINVFSLSPDEVVRHVGELQREILSVLAEEI